MRFKGTKGKLKVITSVTYSNKLYVKSDEGNPTFEENEYNALLFEKASEMLDFISRISGEMLRNDFVLDEKWYDQAQQLIKSATEI